MLRRCLLLVAALTLHTPAQTPTPPHPTSTPYSGDLAIFEEPNRDQKLHIDRVMNLLAMKPGKGVADIGAGGGWFSVRAARRVGPTGKVYAEDINQHAVDAIRDRATRENLPNIQPVLGTPDNPNLPPDSVDAILLLKVYHEVANTPALLAHLREAMHPAARLGIIDRNGNGADHGLDEKIVRAEVERAGFRQTGRYTFTKDDGQDYFLIFQKK